MTWGHRHRAGWYSGNTLDLYLGVISSNLSGNIGYPDSFAQYQQASAGMVPLLGHGRFFPTPFQFIVHQSFDSLGLYSLDPNFSNLRQLETTAWAVGANADHSAIITFPLDVKSM
jgi:hypothetical protein